MKCTFFGGSLVALFVLSACQGGGISAHSKHGGESSSPINKGEEIEYKKALIRCHKTGGTRVVKISNKLRCF